MNTMTVCGKQITVFGTGGTAVWLSTFANEGSAVFSQLQFPDRCTLIALSGLDWNRELSPWQAPALMPQEGDFGGGAAEFLRALTGEIMPKVMEKAGIAAQRQILAGYSLAGLFALWALFQTDVFCAAASMSGSLWYPGFLEFVRTHETAGVPARVYLSVGDRECRTSHPLLSQVQANTEAVCAEFRARGIGAEFELNKGGHTKNAAGRTAKGIDRLLLSLS